MGTVVCLAVCGIDVKVLHAVNQDVESEFNQESKLKETKGQPASSVTTINQLMVINCTTFFLQQ